MEVLVRQLMGYDSFSMPKNLKEVDVFVGLLKVSLFFSKDPVHLQNHKRESSHKDKIKPSSRLAAVGNTRGHVTSHIPTSGGRELSQAQSPACEDGSAICANHDGAGIAILEVRIASDVVLSFNTGVGASKTRLSDSRALINTSRSSTTRVSANTRSAWDGSQMYHVSLLEPYRRSPLNHGASRLKNESNACKKIVRQVEQNELTQDLSAKKQVPSASYPQQST
ncbi:predicted protein [Histoplasma capsulatum H143]|uniref:Uncharacterized protein n=1 Tax=Ajellomyces capsulatus (strain H143) TaxID=544712 RepID=C6H5T9_AJECH|nr:predicted protein [Histoplasma capsulatum H143]